MRTTTMMAVMLLLLADGCQNKPDNRSNAIRKSDADLIELNKARIIHDRDEITGYISGSEQKFTETNTGLWYAVMEEGSGPRPKTGDAVTYDYVCTLLDGKLCYSGNQTITIGYSEAPSGINEGLQMMQAGSDYIFILPPYLAYGLTGDGDMVPGRAILVFRVKVREIK